MLPRRSAAAPSRARTRWFTSWETSTKVLYAGTSSPYRSDRRAANRARSSVLLTVRGLLITLNSLRSASWAGCSDREVHALGERQLTGVVDRVGRSAHVGAPGVGTGLATAAGLL